MASSKALVIQSGQTKQIPSTDELLTGTGLDRATSGTMAIGGTTASAIDIGKVGALTTIKGNLQTDGTETVVGPTTFQGDTDIGDSAADTLTIVAELDGDVTFQEGATRKITSGTPAADTAASTIQFSGGTGGVASATAGGAGGGADLLAGTGGAGTATLAGGAGGSIAITAGTAGADNGGGGANGGNVSINAGTLTGSGTDGVINIGNSTASDINIGNATDNPTVDFLGSGQIAMAANLNANGGLDVTGGNFTAAGGTVDLDPTGAFTLDMDASQTATVTIADNLADALLVQEGANAYLDVTTTNGSEKIELGNATTNPGVEVLGSGLVDIANGTADIPAGTSLSLGGVACTAGVTATNLNTLTDGSNADSLHTHASVEASQLVISSLTTTGLADGDFGYISAAKTLTKTDADATASGRVYGANEGTAGSMTVAGVIANAKFTTAGGSPSNGAAVYLATGTEEASAVGKLTATAPSGDGDVVAEVGICQDNSNYAGSKTAEVLLQPKEITVL